MEECILIRSVWTEEQNLQLLRLLHDVEEGITDLPDYLFLLSLVTEFISDTAYDDSEVHAWAREHEISVVSELPNEKMDRLELPEWLD